MSAWIGRAGSSCTPIGRVAAARRLQRVITCDGTASQRVTTIPVKRHQKFGGTIKLSVFVPMDRNPRLFLLLPPCLLSFLWLWVLFFFPEQWNDRHGTTHVLCTIIVGGWHL